MIQSDMVIGYDNSCKSASVNKNSKYGNHIYSQKYLGFPRSIITTCGNKNQHFTMEC